jgi:hypothetical protein
MDKLGYESGDTRQAGSEPETATIEGWDTDDRGLDKWPLNEDGRIKRLFRTLIP